MEAEMRSKGKEMALKHANPQSSVIEIDVDTDAAASEL